MIFEFAISPSLCTNYSDLQLFLHTFGSSEGRLFSDIPRKKWMRLARQEIKNSKNGQVMKKRLVAAVEKLSRKALYRRNFTPDLDQKPWLEHAIAAHYDRPFKAILTSCYSGNEKCIISWKLGFNDDDRWKIPLDSEVGRTAREMVQEIRPMLDCAKEVVLIDRNFNPDKLRWRQFLVEISISRKTPCCRWHTSRQKANGTIIFQRCACGFVLWRFPCLSLSGPARGHREIRFRLIKKSNN